MSSLNLCFTELPCQRRACAHPPPSPPPHLQLLGEENTVSILKNINVGIYSIFYDTSCCDIISRYQADKYIENRAIQELPGPISIGGVDNARVKSDHGDICQVKLLLHNGKNATLTGTCSDEITTFPSILCKDV